VASEVSRSRRPKGEIYCQPDGLREGVEEGRNGYDGGHQTPLQGLPGNVGPGEDDSRQGTGTDEEFGGDEIHREAADEVVGLSTIELEMAPGTGVPHDEPSSEEAPFPAVGALSSAPSEKVAPEPGEAELLGVRRRKLDRGGWTAKGRHDGNKIMNEVAWAQRPSSSVPGMGRAAPRPPLESMP